MSSAKAKPFIKCDMAFGSPLSLAPNWRWPKNPSRISWIVWKDIEKQRTLRTLFLFRKKKENLSGNFDGTVSVVNFFEILNALVRKSFEFSVFLILDSISIHNEIFFTIHLLTFTTITCHILCFGSGKGQYPFLRNGFFTKTKECHLANWRWHGIESGICRNVLFR